MSTKPVAEDDLDRISEKLLPPRARMLVKAIGLPATLKLLETHGGTPIRIPARSQRSKALGRILSREQLDGLVDLWGGHNIELPKIDSCLIQIRDQIIIARSQAGQSHVSLAREFKLTRRTIINIVNRSREASASTQETLFE